MIASRIVVVSAMAIACLVTTIASSDAAVRRHLRCVASTGLGLAPPFDQVGAGGVRITNQWSFTIPANTTYTVRVGRNPLFRVKRAQALGPGQSFLISSGTGAGRCMATVPG